MRQIDAGLTTTEARAYYDSFGAKQDTQGFYEDPALDDLIAHADFGGARRVFEFGCGTGKLAARLLAEALPASASYLGCDVSETMVDLARRRLADFAARAVVQQTDGAVRFPLADETVDRVVSSYVLDILPASAIHAAFSEAHRVLQPGGKLCLVSLTHGVTIPSRLVSTLWTAVFRLRPARVGGCRPIHLAAYADPAHWRIAHRRVVTPYGIPSEVLVLDRGEASQRPRAHQAG